MRSKLNVADYLLWAQSLDNSSPDHMRIGDHKLDPSNKDERRTLVSTMSSVTLRGKSYDFGGALVVCKYRDSFVVNIPTAMTDLAGRQANIACCFQVESRALLELEQKIQEITDAAKDFARSIGWTIESEAIRRTQDAILEVWRGDPCKYRGVSGIWIGIIGTMTFAIGIATIIKSCKGE